MSLISSRSVSSRHTQSQDSQETDALLLIDDNDDDDNKSKKDSRHRVELSCNEKLGFCFNKFWLYRIGIRMGFRKIRTTTIAEIIFWLFCCSVFGLCLWLTLNSVVYNTWNKIFIFNVFALHTGLLTGMFYALVIFLSLRYPFYWSWGLFMIGFDRQMIFHNYCANLAIITCVLHVIDNYKVIWEWKAITGWICYIFSILMVLFATNYFRRKYYNTIFLYSHWILIIGFIVFGWLHNAILIIYGTFIVLIDVILRIIDNTYRKVEITNISLLDYDRVMKIEFKKKNFKYRAGQYVFIRFSGIGLFEFHPFSLSSYPSSGDILTLHIKSSCGGAWTDKLAVYMKLNEGKKEWYKDIHCQIEGPYGELTLSKPIHEYNHVIFIGGGIGVTPIDGLFNQLVYDLTEGNISNAKVHTIDYIFTTRSRSLINEFASRNRSWQIVDNTIDEEEKINKLRNKLSFNPLNSFDNNFKLEEWDAYHQASSHRRILHGAIHINNDIHHVNRMKSISAKKVRHSLKLTDKDFEQSYKKANIKLTKNTQATKVLYFDDDNDDIDGHHAELDNMAVEELDITNSTHITRVKDESLKKYYKKAYPFINFKRPNIREIIYAAASKTKSKNICVITSGPKSMINDCIKSGAEIGIDVHYEIFDW